jgi:hypothetical protein
VSASFAVPSFALPRGRSPLFTLVRRASWLPAAAVIAVPFFSPGSPVSLVPVAMEQSSHVTISGSVQGLRHDAAAVLSLTLRSAGDAAVTVRSISVRVTSASAGCPVAALSAGSWSGSLIVPAHGAAHATVPVALTDAGGRCAGATWQLAYTSA